MWVAELLQQAPAVYRRSPYGFSLHLHNAIHISGDAYSTMLSPLPPTLLFGATKLYSPEAGACANPGRDIYGACHITKYAPF